MFPLPFLHIPSKSSFAFAFCRRPHQRRQHHPPSHLTSPRELRNAFLSQKKKEQTQSQKKERKKEKKSKHTSPSPSSILLLSSSWPRLVFFFFLNSANCFGSFICFILASNCFFIYIHVFFKIYVAFLSLHSLQSQKKLASQT